jgi:hypothetical protein
LKFRHRSSSKKEMARAIEREPGFPDKRVRYTTKRAGLIAQSGPCALVIVSHALLPHNPQSCLLQP